MSAPDSARWASVEALDACRDARVADLARRRQGWLMPRLAVLAALVAAGWYVGAAVMRVVG